MTNTESSCTLRVRSTPYRGDYLHISNDELMKNTFDSIVVGGGAAGCVVAKKLSRRSSFGKRSFSSIKKGPWKRRQAWRKKARRVFYSCEVTAAQRRDDEPFVK